MEQRQTVKVYSFRVFDVHANGLRVAKHKATREAIVSQLGGEVLEGTGQDVSPAELDEEGRFRRIATGWGELN
jgi:hypothetical protein